MTATEIQLLALHKRVAVRLDEISEHYLGLSPMVARQRAALHQLPFPTFRINGSAKSPLMVRVADLAAHIDKQHASAEKKWELSQV